MTRTKEKFQNAIELVHQLNMVGSLYGKNSEEDADELLLRRIASITHFDAKYFFSDNPEIKTSEMYKKVVKFLNILEAKHPDIIKLSYNTLVEVLNLFSFRMTLDKDEALDKSIPYPRSFSPAEVLIYKYNEVADKFGVHTTLESTRHNMSMYLSPADIYNEDLKAIYRLIRKMQYQVGKLADSGQTLQMITLGSDARTIEEYARTGYPYENSDFKSLRLFLNTSVSQYRNNTFLNNVLDIFDTLDTKDKLSKVKAVF